MTPLYNFDSQENSYLVPDYPYGRMRTEIRFWLEKSETKGFRFCSQTLNPKTKVWNNPNKSTYARFAGCMFLDDKNHTHWTGLSESSDEKKCLEFISSFPEADYSLFKPFAKKKVVFLQGMIEGKRPFTINGVDNATSADIERWKEEVKVWEEINSFLKDKK